MYLNHSIQPDFDFCSSWIVTWDVFKLEKYEELKAEHEGLNSNMRCI